MIPTKGALAAALVLGGAVLLGAAAPTLAQPYWGYAPPRGDHRSHLDHPSGADHGSYWDHRAYGPDARIWRGQRDGQLTPDEARRLAHRERHLDNLTRKARADGKVTPHEARHLRNLADRDNQAIWRLGHNGQRDYWHRYD
jgi:hypothetical protein